MDNIPDYLQGFIQYERDKLLEYAKDNGLLSHFTPDNNDTNEDLRRMIMGALWEHTCQGYKETDN